MIAIFDYGAGNLRSVQNTLEAVGAQYELVRDAAGLQRASKVILPGVGHFGQMMQTLDRMQVRQALVEQIKSSKPFLGICLGLQAMFTDSEEAPEERGLGIYPGAVQRFPRDARVPHMGWNDLTARKPGNLVRNGERPYVYFAHSYYCPLNEATAATCTYSGIDYTAVLEDRNIFGVQFHPEKSGPEGLNIVRRFVEC